MLFRSIESANLEVKDDGFSWNPGKIAATNGPAVGGQGKMGCVIAAANLDMILEGVDIWPGP